MADKCDFCEYLEMLKQGDRRRAEGTDKLHFDYHALIFQRAWNDYTGKAHAGTMTHRPKAVGFEIRFCPECGRRVKEDGDRKGTRQDIR